MWWLWLSIQRIRVVDVVAVVQFCKVVRASLYSWFRLTHACWMNLRKATIGLTEVFAPLVMMPFHFSCTHGTAVVTDLYHYSVERVGSSVTMWENDLLRPTIACIATEDVNKSCQLNNLTLEEMLQPFCEFSEIALPFRSLSGPITLKGLSLRLVRASKMVASSPEANHMRLRDAVGDDEVILLYMNIICPECSAPSLLTCHNTGPLDQHTILESCRYSSGFG